MAYFSNGAEGMSYFEQWCERCVHNGDGEGPLCPVWNAHLLYAYELCNNEDHPGKVILDMLIPIDEEGWNEKCAMFFEKRS